MSRGLLLRLHRISQRKNFCYDWLDFPSIDKLRDLTEIVGTTVDVSTSDVLEASILEQALLDAVPL